VTNETAESDAGPAGPDDFLVDVDGDTIIPTELCGGPWAANAQHGSAVAAVLARAVESVATPVPMRPARFTVDLLSPVPLEPMRQVTRVVKAGKRIAVVDAELHHGDRLVARANALLMRDGADYTLPVGPPAPPDVPIPPTEPTAAPPEAVMLDFELPGFARAMEYLRTRGTHRSGTPASAWIGLRCRVARDEPVTPFQLTAVAADMGSGLGGYLDYQQWRTINADITMHLLRLPRGSRIGLDGEFRADPGGIGMSGSAMFDDDGYFARMTSSTFLDQWGE
jgi:acyl-coenzyme A thioesterase PaaI-like protein